MWRRKKLTRVAAHPPGFCPFTPLKSKEAIHGYSFTCRRQPHSVLKLRISGQRKIFFCAVMFGLQYLSFASPHDPGRLFHPAFARSCSRILFCGCLQSGKFKWGEKSENWNKSVLKKVPVTIILQTQILSTSTQKHSVWSNECFLQTSCLLNDGCHSMRALDVFWRLRQKQGRCSWLLIHKCSWHAFVNSSPGSN